MPTQCSIYNATGYPLKLRKVHNISGSISNTLKAPDEISRGKWGKFTHVNPDPKKSPASVGGVIYSGQTPTGQVFSCLVAWFNPEDTILFANTAYTEIREYGGFDDADWTDIQQKLVNGSNTHGHNLAGFWSIASISKSDPEKGTPEEFEAIVISPTK